MGDNVLPTDVWYIIAKDHLDNPKDVLNLAKTCREMWYNLERQIYIKDVRLFRDLHQMGHLQHVNYLNANTHIAYADGVGRRQPFPGMFPEETKWLYGEALWDQRNRNVEYLRLGRRSNLPLAEFFRNYGGIELSIGNYPTTMPLCEPTSSILHWAAREGILETVKKAVDATRVVDWTHYIMLPHPKSLHQSIHLAAMNGHLNIIRLLVEECSVSPVIPSGNLCLPGKSMGELIEHYAPELQLVNSQEYTMASVEHPFVLDALGLSILGGHYRAAEWLLRYYEPVQYERGAYRFAKAAIPPLHLAALVGAEGLVRIMLDKATPVDSRCKQIQRSTPLMWACARRDNDMVIDTLLERGAKPLERDVQGRTATIWALEHEYPGAAARLITEGLSPGDCGHERELGCHHCHLCALRLSARDDTFIECTEFILSAAEPTRLTGSDLHDVFLEALGGFAQEIRPGSNEETLKLFIRTHSVLSPEGRDPKSNSNSNMSGTPIHLAARYPYASAGVLRLLIDEGIGDVNARTGYLGITPLILAAANCDYGKISGMKGAEIFFPSKSPLLCNDLVELLLRESLTRHEWVTSLGLVYRDKLTSAALVLLEKGADTSIALAYHRHYRLRCTDTDDEEEEEEEEEDRSRMVASHHKRRKQMHCSSDQQSQSRHPPDQRRRKRRKLRDPLSSRELVTRRIEEAEQMFRICI